MVEMLRQYSLMVAEKWTEPTTFLVHCVKMSNIMRKCQFSKTPFEKCQLVCQGMTSLLVRQSLSNVCHVEYFEVCSMEH